MERKLKESKSTEFACHSHRFQLYRSNGTDGGLLFTSYEGLFSVFIHEKPNEIPSPESVLPI